MGQSRWHYRARLWRPLHFLGKRPRARGPHPRRRVRPPAGVARHQWLLHQQRQRRPAHPGPRLHPAGGAHRRGFPPLGRPGGAFGRFRQSPNRRRSGHLRPARPARRHMVEIQNRRDLPRRPRPGRLRPEGGFRGPRGTFGLRKNPRGCRQRGGSRTPAARRSPLLPRFCLRPPHGLAQPQERSRPRRLRQLQGTRRQVRRQRRHPDQERSHRFSGARTSVPAVWRARKDQPGD